MQKVSKIFCPALITPKNAKIKHVEAQSRSQKLLTECGLVKPTNNGTFQLMPLAQRALEKCENLIVKTMQTIQAQKVTLPILTAAALWKKSGRLDGDITEYFMLRDRHTKEFLLSPTHEEAVTQLLASSAPISYRQLPLRLYQIGTKFRDELKPRYGLLRAKEFIMKDLYSFDSDLTKAHDTYEQVQKSYEKLFNQLEVPFVRVEACNGVMGGELSHEFHYMSETAGEDQLLKCNDCGYATNFEIISKQKNDNNSSSISSSNENICKKCNSNNLIQICGIEVAHIFLLGEKYSKPLGATFLPAVGKPQPLVMGCYGIGLTRLMAAALEVLSTDTQLHWPILLAPYDICIIGAKEGSKEAAAGANQIEEIFCQDLINRNLATDALFDDRKYLTIGKRLLEAKKLGYPLIVVIGGKATNTDNSLLELHTQNNVLELSKEAVLSEILKYRENKRLLSERI